MTRYKYDAFISHVFEDKAYIADQLNDGLRNAGFRIWYSSMDLRAGDDLDRTITKVIPACKYGIAIISKNYLTSDWARKELAVLCAQEVDGRSLILPVWHGVRSTEVQNILPLQKDRFALSTDMGFDKVLQKLIAVLKQRVGGREKKGVLAKSKRLKEENPSVNEGIQANTHGTITITANIVAARNINNSNTKENGK